MRVALCLLVAFGWGCSPPHAARKEGPRALLTGLTASVELGDNGLPGKNARCWYAVPPHGLEAEAGELTVVALVNGTPLPPGTLSRGFDRLTTTGQGRGFEYEAEARIPSDFEFEVKVSGDAGRSVSWEVELPDGWSSKASSETDGSATVARLIVSPPMSPPVAARWPRITIEGPAEDQARLDDLARQLGPDHSLAYCGLAPFGSSHTKYTGRVFWDADVWLLPATALTHPERAKAIPRFRFETFAEAKRRAPRGIEVPWETGQDGEELCTGPGTQAAHVTGSAAWGVEYARKLGLAHPGQADRYAEAASEFYSQRASRTPDQGIQVRTTLSPDEYAVTESDAYTNMVAALAMGGLAPHIPRRDGEALNFAEDRGRKLQQHALLLGLWPLEHPAILGEAREILRKQKGRTTENGPAMSLSLEALLEARYDDPSEALATWRQSVDRYAHGPARTMGETPKFREGSFVTGVAGCWSAVVYGFAGIHVGTSPPKDAVWSHRLRTGTWVWAKPNLPQAWRTLELTLVLEGKEVPLTLTQAPPATRTPDSR